MWHKHPDVLVVGAGPVGLFTALGFAEQGHQVEVIDEALGPGTHSYALGIHGRTLSELAPYGIAEDVLARGFPVGTVGLFDGARRQAELRLTELDAPHPFVVALPQAELEDLLVRALDARGVKVRWNHRLSELNHEPAERRASYVVQHLEKESMGYASAYVGMVVAHERHGAARLVVGADGYRSKTRRLLEIPSDTIGRGRTFAVFEMLLDGEVPGEGRLNFDEHGVIVYWPLGKNRCRVSFEIAPVEGPDEEEREKERVYAGGEQDYPFLTEEALAGQLRARLPWFRGRLVELYWSAAVRFQARLAAWMSEQSVCLVGDAAHVTGPAGMQSMNGGFVEASELVTLTSPLLAKGGDLAETLRPWGESVRLRWERALGYTGGLVTSPATQPFVAAHARELLSALPATGRDLGALAAQLGLELP